MKSFPESELTPDAPRSTADGVARQGRELPLDLIVGINLRYQRVARGWSLEDLAREAGISRTDLEQMAVARTQPSIGNVWKLAHAFGVPFSNLLAQPDARSGAIVTTRRGAKKLDSVDGRLTSRALFSTGDPEAAEFYEIRIAPHSRSDAEPHRHGTRENLVISSGTLTIVAGDDTFRLVAGDSINFAADRPHSYVNDDASECWFYLVMNYPSEAS